MAEPDFVRDTRASYDAIAADYTQWVRTELAIRPVDRALLNAFIELVAAGPQGRIADIGCGPGRVTSYLAERGADAFGVDLSPVMVDLARAAYPGLEFSVGSMLDLPLPEDSVGGVVAWYSIIHVPDEQLPAALAEFRRILVTGGHLLLAFQVGADIAHRAELGGRPVSLDFRRREVDEVASMLASAGFDVRTRVSREPDDDPTYPESTPQGFVIARRING